MKSSSYIISQNILLSICFNLWGSVQECKCQRKKDPILLFLSKKKHIFVKCIQLVKKMFLTKLSSSAFPHEKCCLQNRFSMKSCTL